MTCLPIMYVITVDGDKSEPDYTGVTKRITATGAQYQIVGPLAEAIKSRADEIERLRRERDEARTALATAQAALEAQKNAIFQPLPGTTNRKRRQLGHDADGTPLNIIEPYCPDCFIDGRSGYTFCVCDKQPGEAKP
jgi:hypothetical protein